MTILFQIGDRENLEARVVLQWATVFLLTLSYLYQHLKIGLTKFGAFHPSGPLKNNCGLLYFTHT